MSEAKQALSGPNILVMAPGGVGKTYSIGTLVEWAARNQKEVFVLFTENGLETLLGFWRDRKPAVEVPTCLHWHQQLTKPIGLTSLIDAADKVGKFSYEAITKMVDANRGGSKNAFWLILTALANFPDDRTGKTFGPVDQWGLDKIFVVDSLSELANAAMKMVIGSKPTASPSDYGVAQNNLLNFLRLCTQGMPCIFVLTAHIDRNTDEITQTTKLMVKSIGKALYADIPPLFSDVIFAVREGNQFSWDTAAYGVDTKTRSLGYASKLKPDFATILDVWKQRGGV